MAWLRSARGAGIAIGGAALARVLLAYDERDALQTAADTLTNVGCEVSMVNADLCLREVIERRPDLAIIDLGNSESRGLRLCEALSRQTRVPVLAVGSDGRWLVPALSAGADDYLPRPLDLPTLVAKVLALLRRSSYTDEASRLVKVRDLTIDADRCQVTMRGAPLSLTPIEYRILLALARRAGRVLSCAELLKETQGYDAPEPEARDIIKVHIYHLRRKMEPGEDKGQYVVTVPGFGYMLERRSTWPASGSQPSWVRRGVIRQATPAEIGQSLEE